MKLNLIVLHLFPCVPAASCFNYVFIFSLVWRVFPLSHNNTGALCRLIHCSMNRMSGSWKNPGLNLASWTLSLSIGRWCGAFICTWINEHNSPVSLPGDGVYLLLPSGNMKIQREEQALHDVDKGVSSHTVGQILPNPCVSLCMQVYLHKLSPSRLIWISLELWLSPIKHKRNMKQIIWETPGIHGIWFLFNWCSVTKPFVTTFVSVIGPGCAPYMIFNDSRLFDQILFQVLSLIICWMTNLEWFWYIWIHIIARPAGRLTPTWRRTHSLEDSNWRSKRTVSGLATCHLSWLYHSFCWIGDKWNKIIPTTRILAIINFWGI